MVRPRQRGFTLIETIAAIVILTLAIPPMMWAVSQAQRQRVNPMMASKARWLAMEKLEDIIADRHSTAGGRGYDNLDGANPEYAAENPGDITDFPQFSRSISFVETDAGLVTVTPGGGYMTVTVSVGWVDANGDARTLSISTVLTDYT